MFSMDLLLKYPLSLSWGIFICFGSIYDYFLTTSSIRNIFFSITILIVFISTEIYCELSSSAKLNHTLETINKPKKTEIFNKLFLTFTYFLIVTCIVIFSYRISASGLEIFNLWISNASGIEIADFRASVTKYSLTPVFAFIAYNSTFAFIAPLAISLGIKLQNKIITTASIIVLALAILSAIINGERFPFLIFTSGLFFEILFQHGKRLRFILTMTFCGLIAFCLIHFTILIPNILKCSSTDIHNPELIYSSLQNVDSSVQTYIVKNKIKDMQLMPYTVGDYMINCPKNDSISLLRRMFIMPSDVQGSYFNIFGTSLNFYGINDVVRQEPSAPKMSRVIGNIRYRSRHPLNYTKSVNAYSSFAGDSYGRFGLIGMILSVLLLVVIRIAIALAYMETGLSTLTYPLVASFLFWFPFQSSIQAMMISHGFIILLSIYFISCSQKAIILFSLKSHENFSRPN